MFHHLRFSICLASSCAIDAKFWAPLCSSSVRSLSLWCKKSKGTDRNELSRIFVFYGIQTCASKSMQYLFWPAGILNHPSLSQANCYEQIKFIPPKLSLYKCMFFFLIISMPFSGINSNLLNF